MKSTAIAPSNIAFIKYWGKKDERLRLPENGSISMNLSNLLTTTTVEFSKALEIDSLTYNGKREEVAGNRAMKHIDRIRKLARISTPVKIVTENNFPGGTGLSSSASGFAALTLAGASAAGLKLSERELSVLARQGSGSACRSIPDGFVEWVDGDTSDTSYSKTIFPKDHWNICDVVAVVSTRTKYVPTSEGQKSAQQSPFYKTRLENIDKKIATCKKLLKEKKFEDFGQLVEEEALELHSIMLTSRPPLIYLLPETIDLMKKTLEWRESGLSVYFTLNTGQNIHFIVEKKNVSQLQSRLKEFPFIKQVIVNEPSDGVHASDRHLF